jgi:hypothetical protein
MPFEQLPYFQRITCSQSGFCLQSQHGSWN